MKKHYIALHGEFAWEEAMDLSLRQTMWWWWWLWWLLWTRNLSCASSMQYTILQTKTIL